MNERGRQKMLVGTVVSTKMDKTAVVAVERRKQHRLYHKIVRSTKRYKAHDPNNVCKLGDTVRLVEIRPISKEKRWRVQEILQHKEVADVRPSTIGQELEQGRLRAEPSGETTPAPVTAETAEDETATAEDAE